MQDNPAQPSDDLEEILAALHIQKGGVPGISKDALAQQSYYLSCEHTDYETEKDSQHLTNYNKEVAKLQSHIQKERQRLISEIREKMPEEKNIVPDVIRLKGDIHDFEPYAYGFNQALAEINSILEDTKKINE